MNLDWRHNLLFTNFLLQCLSHQLSWFSRNLIFWSIYYFIKVVLNLNLWVFHFLSLFSPNLFWVTRCLWSIPTMCSWVLQNENIDFSPRSSLFSSLRIWFSYTTLPPLFSIAINPDIVYVNPAERELTVLDIPHCPFYNDFIGLLTFVLSISTSHSPWSHGRVVCSFNLIRSQFWRCSWVFWQSLANYLEF